jgi:hypothetical protein
MIWLHTGHVLTCGLHSECNIYTVQFCFQKSKSVLNIGWTIAVGIIKLCGYYGGYYPPPQKKKVKMNLWTFHLI